MQITKNFKLSEFLVQEKVTPTIMERENIFKIAIELQKVRDEVLKEFPAQFKGFKIVSGLRRREWELKQGRSGNSRHVVGDAVDVQPLVYNQADYLTIFKWIENKYSKDWSGGFAVKNPKAPQKGFIHFDLGKKRRWTY